MLSQRGQRLQFDALVIGSGVAGLRVALEIAACRPEAKIALLTKTSLNDSNSYYAQGGIAAVTAEPDSTEQHIADTLQAGDGLCYVDAVHNIIKAGHIDIKQLMEYGVQFDHGFEKQPDLVQEGGHSQRRIFHCADQTGKEMVRALSAQVQQHQHIEIFSDHAALNLITQAQPHVPACPSEVIGAYVLDSTLGLIHTFLANVVVLATGGAGKTYRYTSNPEVATGDGVAMAYRAGARIGNMEFYQFHPTLLYHSEINNLLISEALRGEGAYLRLVENDERFMQRYAPDNMELATRDIVARAIFTEIEKSALNYVHLDARHLDPQFIRDRFPMIYETLQQIGIDMTQQMIPVVPAAHYMCGGILTDVCGNTDIKRLYAIGETAFTGLHGANRLASNSLLEATVMARFAAHDCVAWLDQHVATLRPVPDWDSQCVTNRRRASQINAHWRGLRGEMTSYAGIIRTKEGLKDLLRLILTRRDIIEAYYWRHDITRDLIELRNIILVAELLVRSALQRRESRGGHYREDYPAQRADSTESVWQCNDITETKV